MRISVVVPTFNRSRLTCRAVESTLAQTYLPQEVLVIDDGSTDDTQEALRQFGNQITVLHQTNRGVSSARNLGISESHGDWIAFLDSDDVWLPVKLEKQVRYHEANPHLKISQTDEVWIRNGKRVNPRKKHQKFEGWIFRKCLPLCIVTPSAVIIHKEIFEDIGLFDEALPVCEDYDLWLRIARKYEIGLLPEKLVVKYGDLDDQLSHRHWGMDRFRIQALEKQLSVQAPQGEESGSDNFPDFDFSEDILKELVNKCRIVAQGAAKRGNIEIREIYHAKLNRYLRFLKSP